VRKLLKSVHIAKVVVKIKVALFMTHGVVRVGIWSPHFKYAIEAIERIQRQFTERLPGFSNYAHCDTWTPLLS